jgi:hypothetical protein
MYLWLALLNTLLVFVMLECLESVDTAAVFADSKRWFTGAPPSFLEPEACWLALEGDFDFLVA